MTDQPATSDQNHSQGDEWFARPDARNGERGLRFECTMCGNCCSGPPGYVKFTEAEGRAIADLLGIAEAEFLDRYTMETSVGRSLSDIERPETGFDCIFLDRTTVPGKAVCGIYHARPAQCRTWPFWPSVLRSASTWQRASRTCPGIGQGPLHQPDAVRLTRDRVQI